MNVCEVCKIEFGGRTDAKYCSPRCRVTASRNKSLVTDNVTLSDPPVTLNFKYYTETIANGLGRKEAERTPVKTAKYWYEVPLGAIPILEKGWPKMPEYMNGRQYFLWWQNEFKVGEKGDAVILNPFPKYDKPQYVGGPMSRAWGA